MTHKGAAVNIGDHRDLELLKVLIRDLLRAPVRTDGRKLTHDQSFDKRVCGFVVFRIGAVVSDFGVGKNDDLPGVRGVGEYFLVTGERGIKNYFPVTFAFRAVASAAEDSSIFQRKDCLHWISGDWILSILSDAK